MNNGIWIPKWLERPLILALVLSTPMLFYEGVTVLNQHKTMLADVQGLRSSQKSLEARQLELVSAQWVINKRLCAYLVAHGEADKECSSALYKEWEASSGGQR